MLTEILPDYSAPPVHPRVAAVHSLVGWVTRSLFAVEAKGEGLIPRGQVQEV